MRRKLALASGQSTGAAPLTAIRTAIARALAQTCPRMHSSAIKRGRPRLGSAPSSVESVRLDPELKERLARRAENEGVPVSEVIREAPRHHLEAS